MICTSDVAKAYECINSGKLLAYPTEAVYGLGCDPFNGDAVEQLLRLKQRLPSQGLILLVSSWEQLASLTLPISKSAMTAVQSTWPGPVTWIFPASNLVPHWITGTRDSVAVRMTAHPIARELCNKSSIVSTSANVSGKQPAKNKAQLLAQFPTGVDVFFEGELGDSSKPSDIFDVITGNKLR
jgi:L-threonylcarbamoyladenylate synthase